MEYIQPLEEYYRGLFDDDWYSYKDDLVWQLFLRSYSIIFTPNAQVNNPKLRTLQWGSGCRSCPEKDVSDLVQLLWPEISNKKDLRYIMLTLSGYANFKPSEGIVWFPVPTQEVAICITNYAINPLRVARLSFCTHTSVRYQKSRMYPPAYYPLRPGDFHESFVGLINGVKCNIFTYATDGEPNTLLLLSSFCELYGTSWAWNKKRVEIATSAANYGR